MAGTSEERHKQASETRGGDFARFFGTWVRHPLKMGAVAPSSPAYCRTMVESATTHLDGPVLELGPGLGVVTRSLIEKGVAPERITSIEYDPEFARELQRRFPRVDVICGDGLDLSKTLADRLGLRYAAVLFAIPILNMPQKQRQALFTRYFDRLLPGGNVTQLSYLWTPPVKPVEGLFEVSHSPIVWDNIPPARVWIYERRTAPSGHA
ncbi:class I SAM-dependent methyltransferase [Mangrovibrevibacter kandeliae]|uniref:class I SAM-dependent methyltransferase n=1 Tax=Mangrovibrevibacter kandeliae TaxID=2968473 RepID=UPI002119017B|nr:methyltransferase domain-containing protein [Aurantimonas sp. CSK15Z-1]MCQ8782248.1 methyltransferase domain-containing protein [Aurantimonas sp. CSK15Z-1]